MYVCMYARVCVCVCIYIYIYSGNMLVLNMTLIFKDLTNIPIYCYV